MAASGQPPVPPALSAEQAKGEGGRLRLPGGPPPESACLLPGCGRLAGAECPCSAAVLAEVIKAFGAPENAQRMEEARDNACNDMGKMLQFLLPVATQIQQDVIKAYGFSSDGEGVLKFARLIKSYESQDPEIASMSGKLKAMFLPPMTLPPHGAGTGGVAAS
ncbi:protein C10 isoform X1 [Cinclus cinclus]|uniref:protein C10 isoform X1 n=1 Tax=Cinclus cinclus TaxID=127875 RepID=UPI002E10B964